MKPNVLDSAVVAVLRCCTDLLVRRSAPTLREGAWESVYGVIRTASFIAGRRVRAALLSRLLSRRVPCLARVLRVAQLAAYWEASACPD
jgi:hypothetical protein